MPGDVGHVDPPHVRSPEVVDVVRLEAVFQQCPCSGDTPVGELYQQSLRAVQTSPQICYDGQLVPEEPQYQSKQYFH